MNIKNKENVSSIKIHQNSHYLPRIRTIKPIHWSDKELPNISLQAHLLWIAMWNFSDDEGIIENDPLLIRSNIFPRRTDVRVEQVSQWLDQLVKARFLIPFTFNGEGYYVSRTFKIHQKIDKPQPSKIPSDIIRGLFDEHSTNVQPCIVEDSNSRVEDCIYADEPQKKFLKPSKEDVINYLTAEQQIDDFSAQGYAENFHDHFESNGWKVSGRAPMKDWKAAVRNWIRNSKNFSNGKNGNYSTNAKPTFTSQAEQRRKRYEQDGNIGNTVQG